MAPGTSLNETTEVKEPTASERAAAAAPCSASRSTRSVRWWAAWANPPSVGWGTSLNDMAAEVKEPPNEMAVPKP